MSSPCKFLFSSSSALLRSGRQVAVAGRTFHTYSPRMAAATLNSNTIHNITAKEKELTGKAGPVKGGPTAQAQKHVGESFSSSAVSDITQGERKITGNDGPVSGGPAAYAESLATQGATQGTTRGAAQGSTNNTQASTGSGKLDSETISRITAVEKDITGQDSAVKGGPTAQAQKHAGEPISSQALHDITEGEKKITGENHAIKGGPTSTAQSELSRSRQR